MLLRFMTAVLFLSPTACGQRNDDSRPQARAQQESIKWQAPFSTLSPSDTRDRLIMMLITDADPLLAVADGQENSPKPWCESVLAKSLRGLFDGRPDLRDRVVFQHLAAGIPANLTGGKSLGLPHRAMLVVLDQNHRLLAWMIGVPDSKSLIGLVEDAEEVRLMNDRFTDELHRLGDEVLQRSTDRLDRRWAAALNEQWLVMSGRSDAGRSTRW